MDLTTIIGIKANTAFDLGGIFIPAESITSYLHRYIDPALFLSDVEHPYQFTKSGSLTRVKLKDRYLALTSAHQVVPEGYRFDQLCMSDRNESNFHSAHDVYHQVRIQDVMTELDIVAFDFTETVQKGHLPENIWYDWDRETKLERFRYATRFFCIGYPSEVNHIEYDPLSYAAKAVSVWGTPTKPGLSRRVAFIPDIQMKYQPDGMSGGGVFGIAIENELPVLFFAGILTEATKAMFNFVTSIRIRNALKTVLKPS